MRYVSYSNSNPLAATGHNVHRKKSSQSNFKSTRCIFLASQTMLQVNRKYNNFNKAISKYFFKVSNNITRTIIEGIQWTVLNVDFEEILHLALISKLLTLSIFLPLPSKHLPVKVQKQKH